MVLYANEPNTALKGIHKQTLKEGLFQLKTAVNYMIASVVSNSTSDLSACPILDIIEKGDESTDFLQSSDAAIFTMANIMINDILFGTTVIGMVYELEYGNNYSAPMIRREYDAVIQDAFNKTLAKVDTWTNRPITDLEKNVKQIWTQVKTLDSEKVAKYYHKTLFRMFPQYHVMVEVWKKQDDPDYQIIKEEARMCQLYDTSRWDSTAP